MLAPRSCSSTRTIVSMRSMAALGSELIHRSSIDAPPARVGTRASGDVTGAVSVSAMLVLLRHLRLSHAFGDRALLLERRLELGLGVGELVLAPRDCGDDLPNPLVDRDQVLA